MKRQRVITVISTVCLLVISLLIIWFLVKPTPKPVIDTPNNIDDSNSQISEQFANSSPDAESRVCQVISKDKLQTILNVKIVSVRSNVPTTQSDDGTVSACSYITEQGVSEIVAVVITTREFVQGSRAKELYNQVSAQSDIKITNGQMKLTDNQAIVLKNNSFTSIVFKLRSQEKSVDKTLFEQIANLL